MNVRPEKRTGDNANPPQATALFYPVLLSTASKTHHHQPRPPLCRHGRNEGCSVGCGGAGGLGLGGLRGSEENSRKVTDLGAGTVEKKGGRLGDWEE